MFCYQCEQTSRGTGCNNSVGVCGKDDLTASMQDLLVYAAKGLSIYATRLRRAGIARREFDAFALEALFTTVTNVNFDAGKVKEMVRRGAELIAQARKLYEDNLRENGLEPERLPAPAYFEFIDNDALLETFGAKASIETRKLEVGADQAGAEELVIYGLKGLAAYAEHAYVLGYVDEEIFARIHSTLDFLCHPANTLEAILGKALETGELNLVVMELLDRANTTSYGHPTPTKVRVTPLAGKAILVSGHDLLDLEHLLKQTEGKGVNIYTHGEMLPAHGYPELKKYAHLVGNYGGAWQDQQMEFEQFPGAILMTTNCIQKPRESYNDRIFTSGLVEFPGVEHCEARDFSKVIECALGCEGFAADEEEKTILTGFGRNAVLSVADKVVDAVKTGAIKHFYLIGGCDGAKSGRNYYTDFALSAPKDSVILTLACGKFRFNKFEFGEIGGLPRLMDIGQCNDAYSAIVIASKLAEAFGTDVNGLPLSLVLSWYEQKAVAILLTLLHLGIKNIKIGPALPAFLEPGIVQILVDNYGLAPIGTVENDLVSERA